MYCQVSLHRLENITCSGKSKLSVMTPMKSPVILLLACPRSLSPVLACQAPGDLPRPEIEPRSLALQADSLPDEMPGKQPPTPHDSTYY